MMRLRKIWAEDSFSVLKREHCISKIRKRGILAATEECLLAAMALNSFAISQFIILLEPLLVSAVFFAFVNRSVIVHYRAVHQQ